VSFACASFLCLICFEIFLLSPRAVIGRSSIFFPISIRRLECAPAFELSNPFFCSVCSLSFRCRYSSSLIRCSFPQRCSSSICTVRVCVGCGSPYSLQAMSCCVNLLDFKLSCWNRFTSAAPGCCCKSTGLQNLQPSNSRFASASAAVTWSGASHLFLQRATCTDDRAREPSAAVRSRPVTSLAVLCRKGYALLLPSAKQGTEGSLRPLRT
jgi:hypothetical protein